MTDVDPQMDFRYSLGDTVIEGYQITPATRWQQKLWPPWLKMQRLPDEVNALYSAGDGSDDLLLALPTGDVVLPTLAWVTLNTAGELGIIEALDMEEYTKVVPIPPPVVTPPADGIPDKATVTALKPVPTIENIAGDTNELRNEMMSALKMLQEVGTDGEDDLPSKAEDALDYLKKCLAARTLWCTCSPSECKGGRDEENANIDACRRFSPLVL